MSNPARPVAFVLLCSLLPILLGGCARLAFQRPQPPAPAAAAPVAAAPPAEQPAVPEQALTGELLYDILLGEIAGQRSRLDVSVEAYLRAAKLSQDPRVAERALRIALFAKHEAAALQAAERWVELAPDELEAHQVIAALRLRKGDEAGAQAELDYLIEASADKAKALHGVASLLARDQDPGAALRVMQALVEAHADDPDAWIAYSRLAVQLEHYDLALDAVERALALRPGWTDALILRAHIRVQSGQAEQALKELGDAAAAHPGDIELNLAYARLLIDQDRKRAARAQLERVLEHDRDNVDALYSLGLLALDARDYDSAERYFRRLLELGASEQEARYFLGRVAEARGRFEQALEFYGQVTEGEYQLDALIRAARVTASLGDLDTARSKLEALRIRNPELAVRLYVIEGELLAKAGRYQEAMDLYNAVLAQKPGDLDVLYARALAAEKLDDLELAERDLRRIIEAKPDSAHALNALGYTLADRTDRYQEALEYIERALALAPDDPAILDSMGWVQYRLGNLDAAEQYLRRAYELNDDGEIAAHLTEVLWAKGEHGAARALLDQALNKEPDHPQLRALARRLRN